MPFTGDTFAHLFDWYLDPQRQEKIINARLEAEFDGVDTGLSTLAARVSAQKPHFLANKNADQTGIATTTYTKVTFETEVRDVGGYYDPTTSRWTPPAGRVLVSAVLNLGGTITASTISYAVIYKNGSAVAHAGFVAVSNAGTPGPVIFIDDANGTDFYEVYVFLSTVATGSVLDSDAVTIFQGTMI